MRDMPPLVKCSKPFNRAQSAPVCVRLCVHRGRCEQSQWHGLHTPPLGLPGRLGEGCERIDVCKSRREPSNGHGLHSAALGRKGRAGEEDEGRRPLA